MSRCEGIVAKIDPFVDADQRTSLSTSLRNNIEELNVCVCVSGARLDLKHELVIKLSYSQCLLRATRFQLGKLLKAF